MTSIKKRLKKEKWINDYLKEKLKDVEQKIKALASKIANISVHENKNILAILKEIVDMNKFFY